MFQACSQTADFVEVFDAKRTQHFTQSPKTKARFPIKVLVMLSHQEFTTHNSKVINT